MFMQFVIEEVYPLISKDRLFKRINYTEGFVSIIDDKIKINMSSRKSLGFSGSDVWIKSDYAKGFAITSFKESKICEILYILRKLGKCGKDRIVQYRDEGLACFENNSEPEVESIRKPFIKLFEIELNVNIVSRTNLKVVNFLDLTLNLFNG